MKSHVLAFAVFTALVAASAATAQQIQVNRENRTVAVTVTETIEVQREIALIPIGIHTYGRTQDGAYEDNTNAGAKIIAGLIQAGVKKADIETEDIRLQRVSNDDKDWKPEERKQNQLEAHQQWNVKVPVAQAQKVVAVAVAAGANEVQAVSWAVPDLRPLEAKANAAAVLKARGVADEIAQKLSSKVGALLYATNGNAATNFDYRNAVAGNELVTLNTETVEVTAARPMNLKLFPQKVRRDATVYAIFALE